jgi:hypothetical protein
VGPRQGLRSEIVSSRGELRASPKWAPRQVTDRTCCRRACHSGRYPAHCHKERTRIASTRGRQPCILPPCDSPPGTSWPRYNQRSTGHGSHNGRRRVVWSWTGTTLRGPTASVPGVRRVSRSVSVGTVSTNGWWPPATPTGRPDLRQFRQPVPSAPTGSLWRSSETGGPVNSSDSTFCGGKRPAVLLLQWGAPQSDAHSKKEAWYYSPLATNLAIEVTQFSSGG